MRRSFERAERLAVLVVIAAALFYHLDKVQFHFDESHWIGLSAPFEAFFQGKFTDPIWQTRRDKYLNAPVTYYVIGAARQLGGWPAERLNAPCRFGLSYDENLAQGRVPGPGLLWWGRAGVTTAAIAAIFVSFILFERASNRGAAYLWLALTLVNPYLRDVLRHAMNEGVLLGTLALVMGATYRFLRLIDLPQDNRVRWRSAGWLALAGVASGLAAGTKINGGIAVLGVLLVTLMATFRTPMAWKRRCAHLGLAATILAACSAGAFTGSNPTLWPNPARETVRVVRARALVLEAQVARSGNLALSTFPRRALVIPKRVFYDDAILPRAYPAVLLFMIGLLWAARELYRWVLGGNHSHALVVLTVVGTIVSIPAFFAPLDWPRYFLLPVFFFSFQIVLGMDVVARWLWRVSLGATRRAP